MLWYTEFTNCRKHTVFDFDKPCSEFVIPITPIVSFFETPGMKMWMIAAHFNYTLIIIMTTIVFDKLNSQATDSISTYKNFFKNGTQ